MVGGDVLILVGLIRSEMAEMECCDGEDASHEELMVQTFFAYRHAPKVMRILLVRGGVTGLGSELVQQFEISHLQVAERETVGDDWP